MNLLRQWCHVMASNNVQAMVTMTDFSNEAFNYLLALFANVYDEYLPFVNEYGYIVKKIEQMERLKQFIQRTCLACCWHGVTSVVQ